MTKELPIYKKKKSEGGNLLDGGSPKRNYSKKEIQLITDIEALNWRRAGLSYIEIAKVMDISSKGAYKKVNRALIKLCDDNKEDAEKVKLIELQRLDGWLVLIEKIIRGTKIAPNTLYGGINCGLKIQERRSALLGLDTPKKMQVGEDPDNPFLSRPDIEAQVMKKLKRLAGKK